MCLAPIEYISMQQMLIYKVKCNIIDTLFFLASEDTISRDIIYPRLHYSPISINKVRYVYR